MRNSYKFFLFFIFLTTQIFALEAIKIDEKSHKINLTPHSELFVDAQNHFSYEAVSKDSFADNFHPVNSQSIAIGYTNETAWIRFSVVNEGEKDFDGTVEIPTPWIDTVEAFAQLGEEIHILSPHNGARSFFVPLTISPMQKATIYIKTKSQNALLLAPMLHSKKSGAERLNYTVLFNGILIGVMLIMILYNFINFIALKNRNYLYYGLYLFGLFFLMGTYYGYNREFLFQSSTLAPLTVAFSFLAALLFVGHFFQVKDNFPQLKRYIVIFIAATIVFGLFLLLVASNTLVIYLFASFASLVFLFLFYLSAKAYKEGTSGALYLLLAWIFLGLGELVAFLMALGFIGYNLYLYDLFALMVVLNILMISSALVTRISDEEAEFASKVEKEHELSDRLNLSKKELRDINEKFERKITRLEAELLQMSQAYEKVTTKDETTGLYGKAKLEEILTNELHRAKRYDYLFGIIVINIDGLKDINEKHGREVGNSLMKEMADLLMHHVRYLDTVGRWSDTEYLVVCPETDMQNILVAARHLQMLIEKSKFFFVGSATASFGVTSSKRDDTLEDIMKRGYQALAIAKTNGKNRVEEV